MPKIPVYEQGQLASAAVGTPGVNTAGATAWNALATEADRATNTMLQVAQARHNEKIAEARRLKADADAAAKELKNRMDQADLAQAAFEGRTQLQDLQQNIGQGLTGQFDENGDPILDPEILDNPGVAPIKFGDAGRKYVDGFVASRFKDDPAKQAKLRETMYNALNESMGKAQSTALTKKTELAQTNFERAANDAATRAGNAGSVADAVEAWNQFQVAQQSSAEGVLGRSKFLEITDKGREQAIKNALALTAREKGMAALEAEMAYVKENNLLDETKMHPYFTELKRQAHAIEVEVKETRRIERSANEAETAATVSDVVADVAIPKSDKLMMLQNQKKGLEARREVAEASGDTAETASLDKQITLVNNQLKSLSAAEISGAKTEDTERQKRNANKLVDWQTSLQNKAVKTGDWKGYVTSLDTLRNQIISWRDKGDISPGQASELLRAQASQFKAASESAKKQKDPNKGFNLGNEIMYNFQKLVPGFKAQNARHVEAKKQVKSQGGTSTQQKEISRNAEAKYQQLSRAYEAKHGKPPDAATQAKLHKFATQLSTNEYRGK